MPRRAPEKRKPYPKARSKVWHKGRAAAEERLKAKGAEPQNGKALKEASQRDQGTTEGTTVAREWHPSDAYEN